MPPFKRRRSTSGLPPRAKPVTNQPAAAGPSSELEAGPGQRLQKVLAACGVGSRRDCELLITAGRVEVDGQVVSELGSRVDPDTQKIRVDGELLKLRRRSYYAVYKPVGFLCTNSDPDGRPRVLDLLPPSEERLFTVGRLDLASEGLLLVTNDGDLANQLAHPRYGVPKTYHVQVAGLPTPEILDRLERGEHLAEGFARADKVHVTSHQKQSTWLEMVLLEGKNREVRRLLARVDHKVMQLKRVAIGPLRLRDLEPGEFRRLTNEEVRDLRQASQPEDGETPRDTRRRRPAKKFARGGKPMRSGRSAPLGKPATGSKAAAAQTGSSRADTRGKPPAGKMTTRRRPDTDAASESAAPRGKRPAAGDNRPRPLKKFVTPRDSQTESARPTKKSSTAKPTEPRRALRGRKHPRPPGFTPPPSDDDD